MSEKFDAKNVELKKFEKKYSEEGFWKKIAKYGQKAGKVAVLNALKLYYAMKLGKATPKQITLILGALGYLISPIDFLPDVLPGGLFDDSGILVLVVGLISCCSDPEVVKAAEAKVSEWF